MPYLLSSQDNSFQHLRTFFGFLIILLLAACHAGPLHSSVDSRAAWTSQNGILGGQAATGEESFAGTVVGLYNRAEGSQCTASIIGPHLLLTAAHCVDADPEDLKVIFSQDLNDTEAVILNVVEYRVSPLWATRRNQKSNTGDIAVVRFFGNLPSGYEPVDLLRNSSALQSGSSVKLAGFGFSGDPKAEQILRWVETTIKNAQFSVSEILVEQTFGKGACHGDSGGPGYIEVSGKLVLFGLTSRGVGDALHDCTSASAFTNVVFYANWIKDITLELESSWAGTVSN